MTAAPPSPDDPDALASAAADARRIRCAEDLAEGVAHLVAVEPRFAEAVRAAGAPPLRLRDRGFEALFAIVVDQQISVSAGAAIWARVEAAGATTPGAILARSEEELRALGLSRPKVRTARAIAEAAAEGRLCFDRQAERPFEEAAAELIEIRGIGPWTAEIYHMFCEGRRDVFPAGDLALQEAARGLFDLDARPKEPALRELSAAWRPWRAVAARILWAYYRVLKQREGTR